MVNKKAGAILLILNTVALIILSYFTFCNPGNSVVYVDNLKVFQDFKMTIEMKKRGEMELQERKKTVDSLYTLVTNPAYSKNQSLVNEFISQKEELEAFTERFTNDESLKIWNRIGNYAKGFSEQNGYEIVLGKQPNENILYGDDKKDVSAAFIQYINKMYEGNK